MLFLLEAIFMQISWLSLNASYSHSSLALPLLHLASEANSVDAKWSFVTATINEKPAKVIGQLLEQKPDIISATCYLFTQESILAILRRIKRLLPDCIIILGGPQFLGSNKEFLEKEPIVDAVIRGEGESAFPTLLKSIDDRSSWQKIPGVSFRNSNGEIFESIELAIDVPVEEIPIPSESPFFDFSKDFVQLETARGCPATCTFCTSSVSDCVRYFPMDRIRVELDLFRKHGIKNIRILDRTFNTPEKRCLELLDIFLHEYPEMHFHLELHPNYLQKAILEKLCSAERGRLHLEVGLQTANPQTLKDCKRSKFTDRAKLCLEKLCKEPNIIIHSDLIAGMPSQTMDIILEDIQLLAELGPEEIQLEVLKILPGTQLVKEVDAFGIIASTESPYEVLQTNHLSFQELEKTKLLSRIIDGFYNVEQLHLFTREILRSDPDFLLTFLSFLEKHVDPDAPMALTRRFKFLHQYLREFKKNEFANELEVEWLRQGNSTKHALGEVSLWKDEIGEDFKEVIPSRFEEAPRGSKLYYLKQVDREYWIQLYREGTGRVTVYGEWMRA